MLFLLTRLSGSSVSDFVLKVSITIFSFLFNFVSVLPSKTSGTSLKENLREKIIIYIVQTEENQGWNPGCQGESHPTILIIRMITEANTD